MVTPSGYAVCTTERHVSFTAA